MKIITHAIIHGLEEKAGEEGKFFLYFLFFLRTQASYLSQPALQAFLLRLIIDSCHEINK